MSKDEGIKPPVLRVQSILYGNDPDRILQAISHLNRAADYAIAHGVFSEVRLSYGDCGPSPTLDSSSLETIDGKFEALSCVSYSFFDENRGSARGHNSLFSNLDEDYVLVMNPDVMMAPLALIELMRPFSDGRVGIVEAKQLPIEHPKEYDLRTGETSWAATACALIPAGIVKEMKGFDSETFFLYCDDVDFSWRVRLSGRSVIYQPSAIVYHDKRLGYGGTWDAGEAEKYYSAEAAIFLAYKYSRPDLVKKIVSDFGANYEPHFRRAVASFEKRRKDGTLPKPIDSEHRVGAFVDGAYAKHRFSM